MTETARILVVEDDADAQLLLRRYFAAVPGFDVTYCASATQARGVLAAARFDLLITDYRMPGGDGLELADEARRQHPNLPVLLMTANATVDTAVRAFRTGVTDFLGKPLRRDDVLAAIRTALARSRQGRHRVLAIGAHPDDVEIGAGATLAQHVSAGDQVTILTVSPGAVGGEPAQRRQEAEVSAQRLGARLVLGDLTDTAIPEGIATIELIESVVRDVRPDIVYVHSRHDVHQDHRAVHAASMVATRGVPRVLCYQSPSATIDFHPTMFIPATAGLPTKLEAIAAFASQTAKRDYLDPEVLTATTRYWGRHARATHAEPFEVIRDAISTRDQQQELLHA